MKRKWIFLLIMGYCLATFSYLFLAGRTENQIHAQRNQQFVDAVRGKDGVDAAISSLIDLENQLPSTYTIYHALATKYYMKQDYATAQKYYAKTVRQRPAMAADAQFAYEYAAAALRNGDLEVAKIYLERVKELGIPDGYEIDVQQLEKLLQDYEEIEGN